MKKIYTIQEVAKLLQLSSRTVRDWVKAGELKSINLGKGEVRDNTRITEQNLNEFLKRRAK